MPGLRDWQGTHQIYMNMGEFGQRHSNRQNMSSLLDCHFTFSAINTGSGPLSYVRSATPPHIVCRYKPLSRPDAGVCQAMHNFKNRPPQLVRHYWPHHPC